MRYSGGQGTHGCQFFLTSHFAGQTADFIFSPDLTLMRLAFPLRIVESQQTEQAHEQNGCRQHGHVIAVLAAGNLKR